MSIFIVNTTATTSSDDRVHKKNIHTLIVATRVVPIFQHKEKPWSSQIVTWRRPIWVDI